MFHLFLDVCCIQMFFMLQVFYVVRPRGSRGPADRGAAVRARWGCAHPRPLIPAPECRLCEEIEEWVRGRTDGRGDEGGVRAWGGTKADESRAKADGDGLRGRLDARVRPDIRTLSTPMRYKR
jgi:hypothetical protein